MFLVGPSVSQSVPLHFPLLHRYRIVAPCTRSPLLSSRQQGRVLSPWHLLALLLLGCSATASQFWEHHEHHQHLRRHVRSLKGAAEVRDSPAAVSWALSLEMDIGARPVMSHDSASVYVATGSSLLSMWARDGSLRWAAYTGGPIVSLASHPSGSSLFAMAKNGALYSVETADGRVAWVRWLDPGLDDLRGLISVSGDGRSIYVTCNDGRLMALSTETGQVRWSVTPADHGHSLRNAPVVSLDGGRLFGMDSFGKVYALSSQDGSLLWTLSDPNKRSWLAPMALSLDGATLFAPTDQLLKAIDTADGSVRWQAQVKLIDDATPMAQSRDGQRLYVLGVEGMLTTFDAHTGETLRSLDMWNRLPPPGNIIHADGLVADFEHDRLFFVENYFDHIFVVEGVDRPDEKQVLTRILGLNSTVGYSEFLPPVVSTDKSGTYLYLGQRPQTATAGPSRLFKVLAP